MAAEVLLAGYRPDRREALAEFPLEGVADIAHYRDGLLKAGVPSTRLTLVETAQSARQIPDTALCSYLNSGVPGTKASNAPELRR